MQSLQALAGGEARPGRGIHPGFVIFNRMLVTGQGDRLFPSDDTFTSKSGRCLQQAFLPFEGIRLHLQAGEELEVYHPPNQWHFCCLRVPAKLGRSGTRHFPPAQLRNSARRDLALRTPGAALPSTFFRLIKHGALTSVRR